MSNIVEPGRKKNFCFSFLTFFRRRSKVAPYDPVDCSICFFPIGATRNYYYKCQAWGVLQIVFRKMARQT